MSNFLARSKATAVPQHTVKNSYGSVQFWGTQNLLTDMRAKPGFTDHTVGVRILFNLQLFLLSYTFLFLTWKVIHIHTESANEYLLVVMTSLHLLQNLVRSCKTTTGGLIAMDGTFQLNTKGLPVLMITTVSYL